MISFCHYKNDLTEETALSVYTMFHLTHCRIYIMEFFFYFLFTGIHFPPTSHVKICHCLRRLVFM